MKRERHIGPIKPGPGYEWPRDTQFARNAEAVRHYIGGGSIEVQQPSGYWRLRDKPLADLKLFHRTAVRVPQGENHD